MQAELLFFDSLEILYCEDIIGVRQKSRLRAKEFLRRSLPCSGKRETSVFVHPPVDLSAGIWIQQEIGKLNQTVSIAAFTSESNRITTDSAEHGDCAGRKALCGAESPRQRQLQHQIRTAAAGSLCPDKLVKAGALPSLHIIAGHDADSSHIPTESAPALLKQVQMPFVKGVKFTYDSDRPQEMHTP